MIEEIVKHAYTTPVLLAALGGFMLNMMNLYADQNRQKNLRTEKDILYWVMFTFWPLAGAILAFIYLLDGSTLRPILAFTIGITAPTTLQTMLQVTNPGNSQEGPEIEE